jgi:hypothetical protein
MRTIETIQGVYAAFGRGDIPTILEVLAEDVVWEYGWDEHEVPWLKPRTGKAGVAAFFQTAAAELEFGRFEVTHLVGDERLVVAVIDHEAKVRATGKLLRERGEAHLWHFDARGKVNRFRHGADTLQHLRAFTP